MRRISPGWLAIYTLVWLLLAWPRTGAWGAGAVAVAAGVLLHVGLGGRSGARLSVSGVARFVPFFLLESVRGGIDVSRRALAPSVPVAPDLLRYAVRLPEGPPRIFFLNAISLLPGTFSAWLEGNVITVHRLSRERGSEVLLRMLEDRVAGLFGLDPAGAGSDGRDVRRP